VLVATVCDALPFNATNAWSDSGVFERLSHFKDYGVKGTANDPVNKAAIADGSCRLVGFEANGNAFWGNPAAVDAVIAALKALPDTSGPSHFTLQALKRMPQACAAAAQLPSQQKYGCRANPATHHQRFNFTVIQASLQNWYHALCDVEWAASDAGDPAFMPQQMALTTGFACMAACDCSGLATPSSATFASFAAQPQQARDRLCASLPTPFKAPLAFCPVH